MLVPLKFHINNTANVISLIDKALLKIPEAMSSYTSKNAS